MLAAIACIVILVVIDCLIEGAATPGLYSTSAFDRSA
jgi:hypothetical protein